MCDDAAVEQHLLELAVAPAAVKRCRMQRGERRGVARTGLRQRRLAAREQHVRGQPPIIGAAAGAASCGCASGARR